MYLILPNKQATKRNQTEATKRGCRGNTNEWWNYYTADDLTALCVQDGDGLTDDELAQCVDELPDEFIPKEPDL